MYRFALRRRWIVLHIVLLALIGAFALAGVWQLQRLASKRDQIALVSERQRLDPVSVEAAFRDADNATNRRIRARGRYDIAREVVLRGRANRDRPGNHVLTPLVVAGGRAVTVDRGWVPERFDSPPVANASPPDGPVTVTGVLLPSEGRAPFTSRPRKRPEVVTRVDVQTLAIGVPYRTHPLYLVLAEQDPPQAELPAPITLPKLDEGPHLAYAIQWFLFIAIALIGYGAILRREARKVPGSA
jgi:cytochrome oxidase assembly protein ShyY1